MINPTDMYTICKQAGQAILDIYNKDFSVFYKDDASPFTQADYESNKIITDSLKQTYPDIPVISEEMATQVDYDTRKNWKRFWLVDPLDGSKEFIKKNDQFCIIISLIEHNEPVFGIIYSPIFEDAYIATKGKGAFKLSADQSIPLPIKKQDTDTLNVIGSLSHSSLEFDSFVAEKKQAGRPVKVVQIGSALKFCWVAEGKADIYPRFVPSMEWDTAAGQLLVEECGKTMIDNKTKLKMVYNKTSLKNNGFIVA